MNTIAENFECPACGQKVAGAAGRLCDGCGGKMGGLVLYGVEEEPDALVLEGANGARFRLEEDGVLGEGTFGAVRRARQESTGLEVAVKFLKPGPETTELRNNRLWRFQREMDILVGLVHPGIVRLHTSGVDSGGRPWLAMDLVSGGSLTTWVESKKPAMKERLKVFVRICDAVRHANELGVIHRDLKPDNIVVDERGQPRLIDFGLAKWENDDYQPALTLDQSPGTPMFTAPELLSGKSVLAGARTDEYSLGVVLYWLVGGMLPYDERQSPFELVGTIQNKAPAGLGKSVPGLPRDLIAIVERAMDRDPAGRYGGAGVLGADVGRFLAGEPVEARRGSVFYFAGKFVRRHWKMVAAAAVVLGGAVAAAVFHVRKLEEKTAVASAAYREARSQMAFTINEAVQHLRDVGRMDTVGYFVSKAENFPWDLPVGDDGKSAPAWETGLLKARVDYLNGEACMDRKDPVSAKRFFDRAEQGAKSAAAASDAPADSLGIWMDYRIAALRAWMESGVAGAGGVLWEPVEKCLADCRDFPDPRWKSAVHARAQNGAALLRSAWPMLSASKPDAAAEWLAEVRVWVGESLADSPRNVGSLKAESSLLTMIATHAGDGAGAAWAAAETAWETARKMAPMNVDLAQEEIACRLGHCAWLRLEGKLDEAVAAWHRADGILRFLRENWIFPTTHGSDELLCREWVELSALLLEAKRYKDVVNWADRMGDLINGLMLDLPPGRMVNGIVPDFWPVFAKGQLVLARAAAATGDVRLAAQSYAAASSRYGDLRRLASSAPEQEAHWILLRVPVLLEWASLRADPPLEPAAAAILSRAQALLAEPIYKSATDRAEVERLSALVRQAMKPEAESESGKADEKNGNKLGEERHTEKPAGE